MRNMELERRREKGDKGKNKHRQRRNKRRLIMNKEKRRRYNEHFEKHNREERIGNYFVILERSI